MKKLFILLDEMVDKYGLYLENNDYAVTDNMDMEAIYSVVLAKKKEIETKEQIKDSLEQYRDGLITEAEYNAQLKRIDKSYREWLKRNREANHDTLQDA
jgi:hypothetical protein